MEKDTIVKMVAVARPCKWDGSDLKFRFGWLAHAIASNSIQVPMPADAGGRERNNEDGRDSLAPETVRTNWSRASAVAHLG